MLKTYTIFTDKGSIDVKARSVVVSDSVLMFFKYPFHIKPVAMFSIGNWNYFITNE